MTPRIFAVTLGLSLALSLTPRIGFSAEDQIADAIKSAKSAVEHGKEGHVSILRTYAETALKQAETAEANPHAKEAIMHLNEAISQAKQGHADVATKHAEQALTHLEAAKK